MVPAIHVTPTTPVFDRDSADPQRDAEFWQWLTGWTRSGTDLRHPSSRGPVLALCDELGPKQPGAKNRLHLDVRLEPGEDPDEVEAAIHARGGRDVLPRGDFPWRTYLDPSGNEFCVLAVSSQSGRGAVDDRAQVGADRQGAEGAVVVAAEPGGAEGVGDRRGERSGPAGSPAGRRPSGRRAGGPETSRVVVSASICEHALDGAVEARVLALGQADLGEPGLEHLGLAAQGTQHVERVDVARALPDRVQRRLAEEQRHAGLLDVAVAAEALQRLGHHHRGALADPELGQRQRDPAQRRLVRVARGGRRPRPAAWPAPWRPRTRRRGRRPRSASAACRRAGRRRPSGARRARTPRPARARISDAEPEHAVEPGGGDHLDDRAHAAALVAEPLRPGAVELQLRGGVGAVAQLVLEPYDVQPVALAGREHPRHQEAVIPPGACASTRKTSFIGAEVNHLWPCRVYSPSTEVGARLGLVGAYVGPALLLGHPHAGERTGLLGDAGAARGRRTARPAWASTPWRWRRRRAGPGSRRTSSRSGTRGPARSARRRSRPRGVRGRAGRRTPRAPPAGRGRPRAPSASARRGGSAPRRCGCRSGRTAPARGGTRWRACRARGPRPTPPRRPARSRSTTTVSADACRSTASTSAASEVTVLCPTSGGSLVAGYPVVGSVMALP